MKSRQLFTSFQRKIFFMVLIFVLLLTAVLTLFIYWDTYRTMRSDVENSNMNSAVQMQRTNDLIFRESVITNNFIFLDVYAQAYMDNEAPENFYEDLQGRLSNLTASYRHIANYIYEIGFYSQKAGQVYASYRVSGNNFLDRDDYIDAGVCAYVEQMEPYELAYYCHWYGDKYPYVLTIIKKNKEGTGATFLSLNMLDMGGFVPKEEQTNFYMIAEDGTIIYSNSREQMGINAAKVPELGDWSKDISHLYGKAEGGTDVLISSVRSERYDWYYVAVRDTSNLTLPARRITLLLLIIFVCGGLGVGSSWFISRSSVRPLNTVMDMLSDKKILTEQYSYRETQMITQKLAAILSSNTMLQESLESKVEEFNSLQNVALQYQINPHFLFNTLNLVSVYAAKEVGVRHDLVTMITDLSEILRYSLNTETNLVSLREELDYTRIYVEILEKRHRGVFRVLYQIPEELWNSKVLRLSIQPLIENAIYHGIQPKGSGVITIGAERIRDMLSVWVCDDGVGMSEEAVEELNERMNREGLHATHIGLVNVHKRLRIMFGEGCGLLISCEEGKGVKVSMTLPYFDDLGDVNMER